MYRRGGKKGWKKREVDGKGRRCRGSTEGSGKI